MGGVLVGVFLLFSLGVTWVAGDEEKTALAGKLSEYKASESRLDDEVKSTKNQLDSVFERLKEAEWKLSQETTKRVKYERAYMMEERLRRSLEEKLRVVEDELQAYKSPSATDKARAEADIPGPAIR